MTLLKYNHHWRLILTLVMVLFFLLSTGCEGVGSEGAGEVATSVVKGAKALEEIEDQIEKTTKSAEEIAAETLKTTNEIAKETLDALDKAINTLDQNSKEWQQTLDKLQINLTRDVQSTIRAEISNMLQASIAASSVGIRCNVDFIGNRIKEQLKNIKAKLLKEESTLEPVFCDPVPAIITYKDVQEGRLPAVTIYGYNFDNLSNLRDFKITLVNEDSQIDVTDASDNPSSYLLTINLGRNGVPLDSNSNKLIVEWGGNERYSIGVSQPPPTLTPTPTRTPTPTPTRTPTLTPTPTPRPPFEEGSIEFHTFNSKGDNIRYDTGISVDIYDCGIVGMAAIDGDVEEDDSGDIIQTFMYQNGRTWWIRADFRTDDDHEDWYINTMCINKYRATGYKLLDSFDLDDNGTKNTKMSTNDYICGVVGMAALSGDINERGGRHIIEVFTFKHLDKWHIKTEFYTHNNHEDWTIHVLCVVNDPQLFLYEKHPNIGDDVGEEVKKNINVSFETHVCGIIGISAKGGDIDENEGNNIVETYMYEERGSWWIRADFRTHNSHENWSINTLCVNRKIVSHPFDFWTRE